MYKALIESLEGKQGKPRLKPPFPAEVGKLYLSNMFVFALLLYIAACVLIYMCTGTCISNELKPYLFKQTYSIFFILIDLRKI